VFQGTAFSAVEITDLDNDNDQDIIISGRINNNFERATNIYINNGDNSFTNDPSINIDGVEDGAIGVADINNDGFMDILKTGLNNNNQAIAKFYYGDNSGGFNQNTGIIVEGIYDSRVQLLADIDGDDDVDLLLFGADFQTASTYGKVYRNNPLDITDHPDFNALEALYTATNGQNWLNNTNWFNPNAPISSWFGITEVNGRVTEIVLPDNNLLPNLPPEIGNLSELRRIEIYNTNGPVYGSISSIPAEICNLTNMEYIDLRGWGLGGDLPSLANCMMFNLTWLDLRNNFFTGQIPQEIANLPNLFVFVISNNNFSGPIPDFTNLVNGPLDFFWIENNNFVYADFENQFPAYNASGAFQYAPQKLVGEQTAQVANIGSTITLEVPTNLGSQLSADWYRANPDDTFTFITSGLSFALTINSEADYGDYIYFTSSAIVTGLNLQSANFTIGPDPSTHPDYDALIAIYNALDGPNWTDPWDITAPIETWDTSFRLQFDEVTNRVIHFEYSGAGLSGIIPPEVGDLSELTTLGLFGNDITGEVPSEIWALTNLINLVIGSQQSYSAFNPGTMTLSNGIPPEISNLQQLEWLNLNGIQLNLPLQPELYNLPNLFRLRLQDCGITGQLPSGFSTISDIRVERNNFSGPIPAEILNTTGNVRLAVTNNYFNFSDLEPLVAAANIQFLELSPQRTLDQEQVIDSAPGEDILLTVDDTNLSRNSQETAMNNVYQWFKDGIAISAANENTYTITNAQVPDSGIYYCDITNTLVPDLIIRRANIVVNIDESLTVKDTSLKTLKVFPNPASDLLQLQFKSKVIGTAQVFDIRGRRMLHQSLASKSSILNISNLQSGLYLLKIDTKNGSTTKRFIKH
jgi:hypothetical protein